MFCLVLDKSHSKNVDITKVACIYGALSRTNVSGWQKTFSNGAERIENEIYCRKTSTLNFYDNHAHSDILNEKGFVSQTGRLEEF
jgi:hypothetical protein